MRFSEGIKSTHLFVPRDEVDLARMRRRFTVKSRFSATPIELFKETESWFGLPLYCGLSDSKITNLKDKRSEGKSISFRFTSKLRDYQETVFFQFKDSLRRGKTGFVVDAEPSFGKCLSAGSLVRVNGGWKRIERVIRGDVVKTFTGQETVSNTFEFGSQRVLKIEANHVYSVGCTPEHPLLSVRDGNLAWIKSEDLAIGDYVLMGRECEDPDSYGYDVKARFLGFLVADGCLGRQGSIMFTNDNEEIKTEFRNILATLGISAREEPNNARGSINFHLRGGLRLCRQLESLGLSLVKSKYKHVPDYVLSSKERAWNFLGAYLSCEGYVGGSVEFSSASHQLMIEITSLLLSFGIVCCGDLKHVKGSPYWRAWIVKTGTQYLRSMPLIESMLDRIENYCSPDSGGQTNVDVIPLKGLFASLFKYAGLLDLTKYGLDNRNVARYLAGKRRPTYTSLRRLCDLFGNQVSVGMARVMESRPFFAKVTGISEESASVYDITVDRQHHYIGNGFYSHNTVLVIKMLQEIGRTALVVAPTRPLVNQWVKRLLDHTDLKRSDIGSVMGRNASWQGKKVVVALVHSLAIDYLPKEFKRYFGQVWFDEVHSSVPPETFGPVACMFPSKYRGGASATLDRSDGMEVVFEQYLQEVHLKGHNPRSKKATILLDEFYHDSGPIPNYLKNANQRRGVLLSLLSKDAARNFRIAKHCHLLRKSGRRTVILSDRIDLLRRVERILKGVYEYTSEDIGYYVGTHPTRGRISDNEMKRVAQVCNIILATFGMMKQGSDLQNLAGMILATPQSDPRQSKGRVEGDRAGDLSPVVIDISDIRYAECKRWAAKRVKHYRQSGCKIRRIS